MYGAGVLRPSVLGSTRDSGHKRSFDAKTACSFTARSQRSSASLSPEAVWIASRAIKVAWTKEMISGVSETVKCSGLQAATILEKSSRSASSRVAGGFSRGFSAWICGEARSFADLRGIKEAFQPFRRTCAFSR